MAISKVVYGGRTLIDISDSTIDPSNVLSGVVGYGADGSQIVGTATIQSFLAKCKRVDIVLSASGWSDGAQQVSANVTANDYPFAQVVLSSNYDAALDEMEQFTYIESIETYNGYIIATCADTPNINLTVSLYIVNGCTAANMLALNGALCKGGAITLLADNWVQDGETYKQTVTADITATDIVFADGLFSFDLETAAKEIEQLANVTDMQTDNGTITAICYNGAPEIDLNIVIKIFGMR